MAQLDDFTISLLTNNEVIEVNQDPLGKQGTVVAEKASVVIYAKPMEDGSMAIGLFNRGERYENYSYLEAIRHKGVNKRYVIYGASKDICNIE